MGLKLPGIKEAFLILSWASYDLANQFFALNIVSLYFVRWLTLEKNVPVFFYSVAFGVSMLFVAVLAPLLGTAADVSKRYKPLLINFTLVSIVFTILLSFTENPFLGLIFFAIANFGCQLAVVFYNSLMLSVTPKGRQGLASGLGKMSGYIGALIALYFTRPIIIHKGYQQTFLISGVLYFVFSLPCFIFVKDKYSVRKPFFNLLNQEILKTIWQKLGWFKKTLLKDKNILNFLKAMFFGLSVLNAMILFMSVYTSKVFGVNESELINLVIFSTLFAIGASFFSGYISDYLGQRNTLLGVFFLWILTLLGAGLLDKRFLYLIGALVGISLGSTWVVSRALIVKLTPQENIGEIFGFYNLIGYISGIIGALLWGMLIEVFSKDQSTGYRLTALVSILFIALGAIFLFRLHPTSFGDNSELQKKI